MFTGLVQAMGTVRSRVEVGQELRLQVGLAGLAARIGDSIALSGVCCTVVEHRDGVATFHLSRETLSRTWLGKVQPGDHLNLEGALRAGEPFGGHIVQGHVDGTGLVVQAIDAHAGGTFGARIPAALQKYCVEKGSIALDGVSLTIASLCGDTVQVAVIPHTAAATTLGEKRVSDPLHVEVDVLAKYVETLLAARLPQQ